MNYFTEGASREVTITATCKGQRMASSDGGTSIKFRPAARC